MLQWELLYALLSPALVLMKPGLGREVQLRTLKQYIPRMQKSLEPLSVQAALRLCLLMGAFMDQLGLMWLVVYCQKLNNHLKMRICF